MSKIKLLLLFFGCLLSIQIQAQNLAQAKALYQKGEYAQAKPVFKKYVKTQPSNGNYHLWYGVCCLHTGEPALAVKHLETAVKKRIPSGQLYLGQAYFQAYQFEDAVTVLEDYIDDLTRRKRSTEKADSLLSLAKLGSRLIKGVEEVTFIDSFVVDKADFLQAYKISPESGKLYTYQTYFNPDATAPGTVYETELGNKLYYAEMQPDSTMSILSCNKMQDEWGKSVLLPGAINDAVNANYPYVMTDGITIYYAADGPQSIGGYDIFVTRYNTGSDTYLSPQNVGMPFNSPANDYMYAIDEFNNLGWFASDRNQPEGKVCIYVFIPNSSKQVYNYEQTDEQKMISLARLHAIQDSWTDTEAVNQARQRLQEVQTARTVAKQHHDFEFIIDDEHTYYDWDDFRTPAAKDAFKAYRQLEISFKKQQAQLKELRKAYASGQADTKRELTPAILDLEKRILQMVTEKQQMVIRIRQLEKASL